MFKKINFLMTLAVFFSAGCSTPGQIMKSWVGHREIELYKSWGPPSEIIDNGSDGRIAIYKPEKAAEKDSRRRYINTGNPVEYISPRNNEYRKTKAFYITPMGNIYSWKWK